jgi:Ala-tRNA(Pro) deacylase
LSTLPFTRQDLLASLEAHGIDAVTVDHPPAFTVADVAAAGLGLSGADTKNLFVKDEDGALVLIVARADPRVDLKFVASRMGLGRLSFGRSDALISALGVTPGSVTAFAVVNDPARKVRLVFDQQLMADERINCHPLENTATTNIAREDLLRFIRSTGHEPLIMKLGKPPNAAGRDTQ